jgi:NAD(P)-dependent dehydrogenase (short-subunit alcohol dehydrogenase family)
MAALIMMEQTLLITGGARRLGAALAVACGQAGFNIVIHHKDEGGKEAAGKLLSAIRQAGAKAAAITADLSQAAALEGLLDRAAVAIGQPITGLINSAAPFDWDDIETVTAERMLAHYLPIAVAPALLCRQLLAQLPEGVTGSVINILDQKLAAPHGDHLSYSMAKYALMGLGEMLARSTAPRLRVNAIAPGYTLPAPGQAEADFQRLHNRTPLGKGPQPDDIAAAALYLLRSSVVTGQTLYVDAGMRLGGMARDISFY